MIEACATLARKEAVGLSDLAPALEDVKPELKVDVRFDAKPDVNAIKQEAEEKSKAMMQGWLTKRDSEDGVKEEPTDSYVKEEPGEDKLLEGGGDIKPDLAVDMKPVQKANKPQARTLVVMGTYSIGKERIVKGEFDCHS